jgi:internalin A
LKDLKNLQKLYLSFNKIQDISFLKDLKNLQKLELQNNQIQDVSFLKDLKNLQTLYLRNNQIQDISFLKDLKNLQTLDLWGNQIQDISFLKDLKNLQSLNLSENQIQDISLAFLNHFPKLENLYLSGNPIQNIPKEIFDKQGNILKEVRDYLSSIAKEEDRRQLNEAKLIIVGVGEVGKSEITEALSDANYQFVAGRASTQGIKVKHWDWQLDAGEKFRANIWDFAGQKENYNTHQFFLTENTVYLFVWETRKGETESKFDYWLNIISLLSEKAPILVLQNKTDVYESEINQKNWKTKFPHIIDFYKSSCKTNTGIERLREALQKALEALPNTKVIWNKYRFAIREILENREEEYISYKEYLKICQDNTLGKEQAGFLAKQLHELGIILHYAQDISLKKTIVLKSKWTVDAAYCLVDTKKIKAGRFQKVELEQIWEDERFEEKYDFLLELMKKFELIFQFQESDTYIVPEGLPIDIPENKAIDLRDIEKYLRFEYHYDFMPAGIISRFICRIHHHIKATFFWRYGVILTYQQAEARVELNEVEKKLKIELWGKDADKLLAIVRSHLHSIHQNLKNPSFKEKIPCNCDTCKSSPKPYLHDYDTLLRFQEKGKETRECADSANDVSITSLLEGILGTKQAKLEYLIELIDENDIYTFFSELDNAGIQGNEIATLEGEFVHNGNTSQYADRLKVFLRKHFV